MYWMFNIYLILQGKENPSYPFIVFTVIGLVGIMTTSLVPETQGQGMSESVQDTNALVNNFTFLEWKRYKIELK